MKELLVPILLVVNLGVTSAILGLAMTGNLVAAVPAAGDDEAAMEEAAAAKPAFYHEFKPELVVNFPGGGTPRYMQLAITAVTGDEAAVAALELHAPAIRNDLLLLFSGMEAEPLSGREGKEGMRAIALETIRGIMKERYGQEAIDDVYFTRFVMQ
jgi:flagellar FliL protein